MIWDDFFVLAKLNEGRRSRAAAPGQRSDGCCPPKPDGSPEPKAALSGMNRQSRKDTHRFNCIGRISFLSYAFFQAQDIASAHILIADLIHGFFHQKNPQPADAPFL